jgi:hypothetical protein
MARYGEQLATLGREHVGPRLMTLLEQLRAEQGGDARRTMAVGEELLELFRHGWERSGAHVEALCAQRPPTTRRTGRTWRTGSIA